MKYLQKVTGLIILVIYSHLSVGQTKEVSKSDFLNKELKVIKLVINEKDLSDNLATVIITNYQWKEYNHDGKIIGVAKILKLTNTMLKVEWTQADNGASVGEVTLYNLSLVDDVIHFKIHFDGNNQGYFDVNK